MSIRQVLSLVLLAGLTCSAAGAPRAPKGAKAPRAPQPPSQLAVTLAISGGDTSGRPGGVVRVTVRAWVSDPRLRPQHPLPAGEHVDIWITNPPGQGTPGGYQKLATVRLNPNDRGDTLFFWRVPPTTPSWYYLLRVTYAGSRKYQPFASVGPNHRVFIRP